MGMSGAELIRIERQRQITVEQYTPEHDKGHAIDLAEAAVVYTDNSVQRIAGYPTLVEGMATRDDGWPWASEYWKPTGNSIRDLVKAGALIAAAIDSLIAEDEAATVIAPAEGIKR